MLQDPFIGQIAGDVSVGILFGFFLCCTELLKLECAEIEFNAEGLVLNITSSKSD